MGGEERGGGRDAEGAGPLNEEEETVSFIAL